MYCMLKRLTLLTPAPPNDQRFCATTPPEVRSEAEKSSSVGPPLTRLLPSAASVRVGNWSAGPTPQTSLPEGFSGRKNPLNSTLTNTNTDGAPGVGGGTH